MVWSLIKLHSVSGGSHGKRPIRDGAMNACGGVNAGVVRTLVPASKNSKLTSSCRGPWQRRIPPSESNELRTDAHRNLMQLSRNPGTHA